MNIRDAQDHELPRIRSQRVEAYRPYAELIPEGHWAALKQAISSEADRQSAVELIVAEIDNEIAGSVVLFPAKTDAYEGYVDALDHPEIRMLAVGQAYQGQGIASALVSECMRRAKAHGHSAIGLHTGDFMKPALRLYEKMGFNRFPQYDFEPANDGIIVRAYQRQL